MLLAKNKYLLGFLVFTLVGTGIILILSELTPGIVFKEGVWHIFIGFAVINYMVLRLSSMGGADPEKSTKFLLISIVVRFLFTAGYCVFLMAYFKFTGGLFISNLLIIYLCYLVFDIIIILSTLRPNSKRD